MRKLFLLNLCVFFVFICSSCGSNSVVSPVTNFSATMQVQWDDVDITGDFSNTYQGVMTFSVSKPDTLNGFKYVYKDNELEMFFENLKCNTTSDYLPKDNYLNRLYACLNELGRVEKLDYENINNTQNCYTINTDNRKYEIYINSKTGLIEKIESENFTFTFSNQKEFT